MHAPNRAMDMPLLVATCNGHAGLCMLVLEREAAQTTNAHVVTPLHLAARRGHHVVTVMS